MQLWNLQVMAALLCSRQRLSTRQNLRDYVCFVGRLLKVEADLRGLTSPPSTANTTDLRKV